MVRKPRNARTERLTNWKFFVQIYLVCNRSVWRNLDLTYITGQFIGLMVWPCCMSMWFTYMSDQGFGFYDVILVYDKWADGYKGYSLDELTHFVRAGQCT
jgi:sodium/potassium-transporting ATPase subunit alpha